MTTIETGDKNDKASQAPKQKNESEIILSDAKSPRRLVSKNLYSNTINIEDATPLHEQVRVHPQILKLKRQNSLT